MRFTLIGLFLLVTSSPWAQEGDPPLSGYRYNPYTRNPGAAGAFYDLEGTGQFNSPLLEDSPILSTLSFYTKVDQLSGAIGANMFYYYLGNSGEQNVNTEISYTYRTTINDFEVGIGASGGILTKGTVQNVAVQFPGQNLYEYSTTAIFDGGIFINNDIVWVGLSMTNINQPYFHFPDYHQQRTIHGMAGVVLNQGKVWELEPSTMISTNSIGQTVDANLGIRYITKFVGGIGFRIERLNSGSAFLTPNGPTQNRNWGLFKIGYEDHGFRLVYAIDRVNIGGAILNYHEVTFSAMIRKADDPYVEGFLEE